MAYFLRAGDSTSLDYVEIPSFTIPPSTPFRISVKIQATSLSHLRPFGDSSETYKNRMLIFSGLNGIVRLTLNGVSLDWTPISNNAIDLHEYTFERNSSNLITLKIDGVLQSQSFTNSNSLSNIVYVLTTRQASELRCSSDLYHLKVDINGVPFLNYNPSLSNGTGNTLIDSVSGNNGTLTNFPTDDSQWVFYEGGGGVESNLTVTAKKPTVSISSAVTLPQPNLSVSADSKKPTVSTIATATLPQPVSNVVLMAKKPSVGFDLSATLPSATSSISILNKKPTVSIGAEVTLPQPASVVNITNKKPVVTVTSLATLPSVNAAVSISSKKPIVSISASVSLPNPILMTAVVAKKPIVGIVATAVISQPAANVSIFAKKPTATLSLMTGSVVIISTAENTIYQSGLSNTVTQPRLSNTIQLTG